jgi:transposase
MEEYIAFDSHKYYTVVEREQVDGASAEDGRIEHAPGAIRDYLQARAPEPGTPVAVEATGNWYWIVHEIEQAGLRALLVHPRKAKLMMGMINKTDKLDVHGLNVLQRNGTLPTVWIPPGGLRDLRELTRTRMALSQQRTRLKNRISSTLAKYGLQLSGVSDAYGVKARHQLEDRLGKLPPQTHYVTKMLLGELDRLCADIAELERRLQGLVEINEETRLLMSLPGVGVILAPTIALEIGEVRRFASAERLASYAGTTPRVHSSGGKVRYGSLRPDVNRYLRWAFVEAANSVAVNHLVHPARRVSMIYRRIRARKCHAKAIGAVARHLAEAAFHVLTRREAYREPGLRGAQAREA